MVPVWAGEGSSHSANTQHSPKPQAIALGTKERQRQRALGDGQHALARAVQQFEDGVHRRAQAQEEQGAQRMQRPGDARR